MTHLTDPRALDALFGAPAETSLRKEAAHLHPVYRDWIARSPFAVLATSGPAGLDTSPRGDPAPLVRMPDAHTLLLPERRGNNRVDSLRNILADPRVSLIFFVPGISETVRVNGLARLNIDPALLDSFALQGQAPKCVIEVAVQAVFFQCAKALVRSRLWAAGQPAERPPVPTAGQMLGALTQGDIDGAAYDQALPARQAGTLY
ncbi:pyridoxamine 5'-phosphate oxidase family protein [Ideonella sp. DXS22W]|uniref:Pyridoxamine 5'-phosphate oxidase family protein n=1 Tax=Pseudaquabacterium inlustre TaxID=2984192 RepID=A0ABU9CGH6_9BURK